MKYFLVFGAIAVFVALAFTPPEGQTFMEAILGGRMIYRGESVEKEEKKTGMIFRGDMTNSTESGAVLETE